MFLTPINEENKVKYYDDEENTDLQWKTSLELAVGEAARCRPGGVCIAIEKQDLKKENMLFQVVTTARIWYNNSFAIQIENIFI